MTMTMDERLDDARAALRAYFAEKGETTAEGPSDYEDTDASDLIADLLHLQKHLGYKDAETTRSRRPSCTTRPSRKNMPTRRAQKPEFNSKGVTSGLIVFSA